MGLSMRYARSVACVLTIVCPWVAECAEVDDAWPLYQRAAAHISKGDPLGKFSPSASSLEYKEYPPFPPEWERMAKAAYEFNAPALADVHRATAAKAAAWPVAKVGATYSVDYLGPARNIANQVADAALFEHVRGDDAAAIDRVRDLLHLVDLLDDVKGGPAAQWLTALGIRAVAMNRLQVIDSDVRLTDRPTPADKALPVADVQALIKRLFVDETDLAALVDKLVARERVRDPAAFAEEGTKDRLKVVLGRDRTERNLTAMSLACRLFRFQHKRWPASLDELSTLLPARPADVAGPMGYALIKGGLPGGGDRPLVFSHIGVPAGGKPEYPTAEPLFSHYAVHVPGKLAPGQFRDVSLWAGKPSPTDGLGLKPLE
jgi:hypothetical protein